MVVKMEIKRRKMEISIKMSIIIAIFSYFGIFIRSQQFLYIISIYISMSPRLIIEFNIPLAGFLKIILTRLKSNKSVDYRSGGKSLNVLIRC
jgi:hypothetical protein